MRSFANLSACVLLLPASILLGQDTNGISYSEPFPAKVNGTTPIGYVIAELKIDSEEVKKTTQGPYEISPGKRFAFEVPVYVLQPVESPGGLYVIEPGFSLATANGQPKSGTTGALLISQMDSLRVTTEQLRQVSQEIASLRAEVAKIAPAPEEAPPEPVATPAPNPPSKQKKK